MNGTPTGQESRKLGGLLMWFGALGGALAWAAHLFIAWGASYYNDHLASAATVNGQSISKDAWNKQMAVNAFRADYEQRYPRLKDRFLEALGQA